MNTNTTINLTPFTKRALPPKPRPITACVRSVRDSHMRGQLASGHYTPDGVAAELRTLILEEEALHGPLHRFVDLVDWVACPECNDGLFEQVMDSQYEALLDACALLGELEPALTTGSLIGLAAAGGGPVAEREHVMRDLMEQLPGPMGGARNDLLVALSGLAETAWMLVDAIRALRALTQIDHSTVQATA